MITNEEKYLGWLRDECANYYERWKQWQSLGKDREAQECYEAFMATDNALYNYCEIFKIDYATHAYWTED